MTDTLAPTTRLSPYQGLGAFGAADTAFFFGRDEERDIIIAQVKASRLTVLYGPSGVGKTSLLRAGVETELRRQASRNQQLLGTPEFVPVLFSAWREDPSAALAATVVDEVMRRIGVPIQRAGSLGETLRSAAQKLDAKLLLILDQFEDLALYDRTQAGPRRFAAEFPALINDRALPVNVLVSIREDALAQMDRFRASIPRLLNTRIGIRPLAGNAARQAITGPLDRYNDGRPRKERVSIEGSLVGEVLAQVRAGAVGFSGGGQGILRENGGASADPASDPIEAPYLQLVMTAIWDYEREHHSRELRLQTLHELGDATHIVRTHLDHVLGALSDAQRGVAVDVFRYLVTPSRTKIAFGIGDLAELSGRTAEDVEDLVQALEHGQQRILRRVPPPPGEDTEAGVEIFHDVLAPAILAWRAGQVAARLELERQAEAARLERERQAEAARLERERQAAEEEKRAAEQRAMEERRRARRFRALAVGAFTLLLIALGAVVVALVLRAQADSARRNAQSAGLAAQAQADYQSPQGTVGRGLLLSIESYRTAPTAAARDELVQGLETTHAMNAYLSPQSGPVGGVAFSPGGRELALATVDGSVFLWNLASGRGVMLPGHQHVVESVAFSPTRPLLASVGLGGQVTVWSTTTDRQVAAWPASSKGLYSVKFNPAGTLLASAGADGDVRLWDTRTWHLASTLGGHAGTVYSVAFNRTGDLLASANADATIALWSVVRERRLRMLRGHTATVNGVAFNPSGTTLASASNDGTLGMWDIATGRRLHTLRGHTGAVEAVAFSRDGTMLASASADRTVGLWNASSGQSLRFLHGHAGTVQSVDFSAAGDELASGGNDGAVILWDLKPARVRPYYALGDVYGIAVNPRADLLAAASQTSSGSFVKVWNLKTGALRFVLPSRSGPAEALAFSPDGTALALAGTSGSLTLWDLTGRRVPRVLPGGAGPLYAVAFSPDGATVAAASDGGSVLLWRPNTSPRARVLPVDHNPLFAVAFSPDASTIATGGASDTVIVANADGRGTPRHLIGHTGPVESVAFNPDGSTLASASDDRSVILWDPATGQPIGDPLTGHLGAVTSVVFSANGRYVASGSVDQTAIIWNLDTRLGQPIGGHVGTVTSVAFGPRGTVFTGGADGLVDSFPSFPTSDSPDVIDTRLCRVARRNLTPTEWREFLPGRTYAPTCPGYP